MSAEHEPIGGAGDDWSNLSQTWQAQAVSTIDVDQLRAETQRRSRHLRWALSAEVLMTLGLVAYLAHAAWSLVEPVGARWLLALMIPLLVSYQAWSLWLWRRQLHDEGLDVRELLLLEIKRARTSILYWRVGVWVGVALVAVLSLLPLTVLPLAATEYGLGKMAGAWVGGVASTMGCAAFAWAYGRRLRAQIARWQRLLGELGAE